MNNLKYFNQDGYRFLSKKNPALVFILLIVGCLLLVGAYRVFPDQEDKPGKILLIVLACIAFLFALTKHRMQLIIDTSAKTFEMKGALVPKKLIYSFDNISRFEVQKAYKLRILLFVSPLIYFKLDNGKEKFLMLKTFYFNSKPAQYYLDEIQMIMKKAETR